MKDRKESLNSDKNKGLFSRRDVLKAAGTMGIVASLPTPFVKKAFGAGSGKKQGALTFAC